LTFQTSGLALEEIDTLFGKEKTATVGDEENDKAVEVGEEHEVQAN
jgi:hypothetical protein